MRLNSTTNSVGRVMTYDLDNNLLQTLYDIRQIPWDRDIVREKNYTNFDHIPKTDVEQLQSLSGLTFHYFSVQSDYISKQLTYRQQFPLLVDKSTWKKSQNTKLLQGIDHHFSILPDEMYIPPTQGSIGSGKLAKIDTLLAALDTMGRI